MASSPTRSGTLRPHFLMAVGLGPAQGALSPERRDAPTPRTWPGSRTGSQLHHLSARAAPRGPQAPGSPRPAGSGSPGGRRRPSTNRTSFVSPSGFRLAAADGRRPSRRRRSKASPHPCHEEEPPRSRRRGGPRGVRFDDACAVVVLVADAPSAPRESQLFGVNYFCRWTIIVFAGSARRGSRINNRERERSRRNGGTTSAESRVGHAATCSVAVR